MSPLWSAVFVLVAASTLARAEPERVTFPSADGKTTLVGFLYRPSGATGGAVPAMVLMHGRAGAYSQARGIAPGTRLSQRHQFWGEWLAERGYAALLVDGFGPRGYPQGFPRFSYESRPAEVNEVIVRPLDAEGALAYLRSRRDIDADRVGLMGWSNGGSATIAAMAADRPAAAQGFKVAIAFYPACGLRGAFDGGYRPYAPLRIFMGRADEEVSPTRCGKFAAASRAAGGDIAIRFYGGATHGFDDPGARRQRLEANALAREHAVGRIERLLAQQLSRPPR